MAIEASFTTVAIMIVAFIAGFSIVSFIIRKLREGPFNPDLIGPHPKDPDPTSEARDQSKDQSKP
ncbi:MAG: hypothetical protein WAQ99_10265 [Pyrinomonadaceae bacterium]